MNEWTCSQAINNINLYYNLSDYNKIISTSNIVPHSDVYNYNISNVINSSYSNKYKLLKYDFNIVTDLKNNNVIFHDIYINKSISSIEELE